MGNNTSTTDSSRCHEKRGHHECEVLGRGPEAAESQAHWNNCEKNPGHKQFIPAREFLDGHWTRSLSDENREMFRSLVDHTVRIRVQWTSTDRPDDDTFSNLRGEDFLRLGTGFITHIYGPYTGQPCPCRKCDGKVVRKHWGIYVSTAKHVVYNTEEARKTKIDLFYDYESCQLDGTMKTEWATEVLRTNSDEDWSRVMCVTHDEDLISKLKPGFYRTISSNDFSALSICRSFARTFFYHFRDMVGRVKPEHLALIVSHPHGQPKMVTLGELKDRRGEVREYNTPTCPGSSGATVCHVSIYDRRYYERYLYWEVVHSGTHHCKYSRFQEQVNYGHVTFPSIFTF